MPDLPDLAALVPVRHHYCPNCGATDATREAQPHTRFHSCSRLGGMSMPMVPQGVRAKVEAVVREDYVGAEDVQYDGDGRPIMAALTTRDDGTDVAVYAPTAHARAS